MTTFIVPDMDEEPWPSLGGAICDLIEERAVFGPGSLKGQPAKLDGEKRAMIWKLYELYPKGHELEGRRRFKRGRVSWRKGTAKTEFGGWLSFAELHPEGPVRFDGWDSYGNPVGRPVRDPYIPMLAFTQAQVSELAYGVLFTVATEGPDADLFDAGLDRVIRLGSRGQADGRAVPLAGSPNSRDGARTTFQYYDETHRLDSALLVEAYNTMEANLPKRPLDDPWSLGTTTAGVPGGGSVAELDKDEAEAIGRGEVEEPELFYFHREASVGHDLTSLEGRVAAVREASGPSVAAWSDLRSIAKQWDRKGVDRSYLERVWLNRWTASAAQAFDVAAWDENERPDLRIEPGASITLGLDGSKWKDTTALVATDMRSGLQQVFGLWSPLEEGEVDEDLVEQVVVGVSDRFDVVRMYGDPAWGWDKVLARLASKLGPQVVMEFWNDSRGMRRTAYALRSYANAISSGTVFGDGNLELRSHLGHAQKFNVKMVDDEGAPLWSIKKDRPDSDRKIDLAMAGMMSHQAYLDSLKHGWAPKAPPAKMRRFTR